MKRQGNLLSFAFFGLISQAAALLLLGEVDLAQHAFGFLFAANAFMLYRVVISEKWLLSEESYIKKELRRWWLRQEPENTFAFALVGGILLTVCNFGLWGLYKPVELWAMSFVAIGLTQIGFEASRQLLNSFNAYLFCKVKQYRFGKMVKEVKRGHELCEVAYQGSH